MRPVAAEGWGGNDYSMSPSCYKPLLPLSNNVNVPTASVVILLDTFPPHTHHRVVLLGIVIFIVTEFERFGRPFPLLGRPHFRNDEGTRDPFLIGQTVRKAGVGVDPAVVQVACLRVVAVGPSPSRDCHHERRAAPTAYGVQTL